jgi:hypothetical protein
LLLLLLELLLELLRDSWHRRSTGLEALLLGSLPGEACILGLELARSLQAGRLWLHAGEAGILLLHRSGLSEAGRLGSEGTWLLLLLTGLLASAQIEGASILLGTGPQAVVAAEERVRTGIHGAQISG